MTLVRTPDEIVARRAAVGGTLFDFQSGDLLDWLPYELAKPDLKEETTAEQWAEAMECGDPLDKARGYMEFAWGKANDCRGLSAIRSVSHLKAWLWLAGYDVNDLFDREYQYYGKPCLVVASELLGFDWRAHDDGGWRNDESGPDLSDKRRESIASDMIAQAQALGEPANG